MTSIFVIVFNNIVLIIVIISTQISIVIIFVVIVVISFLHCPRASLDVTVAVGAVALNRVAPGTVGILVRIPTIVDDQPSLRPPVKETEP